MHVNVSYHNNAGATLCAHTVLVTAQELEPIGAWAGSMKVAAMDQQFDLYLENPRDVLLDGGIGIPVYLHGRRLSEKGIALSVTANLGETFFAWYCATWLGLSRDDVIHLRTSPNEQTPDFLAKMGPLLKGRLGVPLHAPEFWPIEIKTRFGQSAGNWASKAKSQLESFWTKAAPHDGTTTQARYGLAVLFRRKYDTATGTYSAEAEIIIHTP